MHLPDRGAGRGAELLAQAHAQVVVDAQRLGGVAACGQRLHQHAVAALAERRRRDDRARRALGRADPGAAQLERRRAHALERAQAHLLDVAAALLDPRMVVGEQERAGRRVERVVAGAAGLRPVRPPERGFCALGIRGRGLDVDPCVVRQGERELAPARERARAERAAQLREHRVQHLVGVGRRLARPQQRDQLVAADRPRAVPRQVRDQQPRLAAAQHDLPAARSRRQVARTGGSAKATGFRQGRGQTIRSSRVRR